MSDNHVHRLKSYDEIVEKASRALWDYIEQEDEKKRKAGERVSKWVYTRIGWAIVEKSGMEVSWAPQRGPQVALLECPVDEVFFGGARGGGKTDAMIGDFAQHAWMYGDNARGIFFRRRFKQLEEVLRRTREVYGPLGATYNIGTATWTFPNGATLKLRHLFDVRDASEYQGHSYTWVCFEELTNWPTAEAIDAMRGVLRSIAGVPCLFRATGNPGGPGHNWVKARYVDPWPKGLRLLKSRDTGLYRVYIPSRLSHNRLLKKNDPLYEKRLMMTGAASLVRAWLEGDWDITEGGFLDDVFRGDTHVLMPFSVPRSWDLDLSFDWGSAKPASLGIWARSDGNCPEDLPFYFPAGSLIRVAELYTVAKDSAGLVRPDEGLRLSNIDLGKEIGEMVKAQRRKIASAVADPSVFKEEGGPCIHAQMEEGWLQTCPSFEGFERADNSRIAGWQRVREMLMNAVPPPSGRREHPGLWVFSNCVQWIRTVPVLPRDPRKPDDVLTSAEDHAGDETRYEVMSLPSFGPDLRVASGH